MKITEQVNTAAATPPKVSVVMATYNGEKFLQRQLDSIVAQTYPNIEIIITDDCSTDATAALLQHYADGHSNITLVRNEKNIGYIKNFEKAIMLATADYIALSDQDDIWHPEKISVLMKHINGANMVYCNSELIDNAGNSMNKNMSGLKNLGSYNDCLSFLIANGVFGHAVIMHKSIALKAMPFPADCPHDWILAFVASFCNGIVYVDELLVKYRQHADNISGLIKTEDRKEIKKTKHDDIAWMRKRMTALAEVALKNNCPLKEVIVKLAECYNTFSFKNNFNRMMLFFKYRNRITAFKKRNNLRRWIFCIKMFYKLA